MKKNPPLSKSSPRKLIECLALVSRMPKAVALAAFDCCSERVLAGQASARELYCSDEDLVRGARDVLTCLTERARSVVERAGRDPALDRVALFGAQQLPAGALRHEPDRTRRGHGGWIEVAWGNVTHHEQQVARAGITRDHELLADIDLGGDADQLRVSHPGAQIEPAGIGRGAVMATGEDAGQAEDLVFDVREVLVHRG